MTWRTYRLALNHRPGSGIATTLDSKQSGALEKNLATRRKADHMTIRNVSSWPNRPRGFHGERVDYGVPRHRQHLCGRTILATVMSECDVVAPHHRATAGLPTDLVRISIIYIQYSNV